MIGLTGSPQRMTPGYNPVYWYATSTNVTEDNFRYLFTVKNLSTGDTLADLKIKPRYGDDLMEINISKILDNDLTTLVDDFNINTNSSTFNNTINSGYQYGIEIGEQFSQVWEFADTNAVGGAPGEVNLVSLTPHPFIVGDSVVVTDASEYFTFTDNQFDSGSVGFLMSSNPVGIINIGDTVTIQQDSPFTFPQYNGTFEVTNVTSTVVTVDFAFQGNTPPQGGTLITNFPYDGLKIVTEIGVISSGAYTGYYYVAYGQGWLNNSQTHTGTVVFDDNRLAEYPALLTDNDNYTFNGAELHSLWPNWISAQYDPSVDEFNFLSTIPDNYTVSLDDDVFLNYWGNLLDEYTLEIISYNSSNIPTATYSIISGVTSSQTEVIDVSVGPLGINTSPDISVTQNGGFGNTSSWIISTFSSTLEITGGELVYSDPASGAGISTLTQNGVLTPGCFYTVSLETSNNNEVSGMVGDEVFFGEPIFAAYDNGVQTVGFTAAGYNFILELSTQAGAAGVDIDNLTVSSGCDLIDCDTDHYTVQINRGLTSSEIITFNIDCSCLGRYTNYPILFMDRFGSFIPFDFSLNNKQKVGISREQYKKFIGGRSNAGPYTYNTSEHSMRNYDINLEETWEINTNWMTEVMSLFFEELVTSPIAFILINGSYHAINVDDKNYERVRKNNEKMIRYTLNISFSNNNTINI